MPSPSSYVEPSVNGLAARDGVNSATISGFITKPPAAITVLFALMKPVSSKRFQATPTTRSPSTTSCMAPVSRRISTPSSAALLCSRPVTSEAPWVSPGTGTLWPRGAGFAISKCGQHFSLPVNIRPSVPGWMTAFSG